MPNIVWSRQCPKCKGQVFLEDNEDGMYLCCIQCGHSENVPNLTSVISLDHRVGPKDRGAQLVKI